MIALQRRYEAVWAEAIRRLQEAGEWTLPTRVDRLLMFGALNWIAHWYRPDGALDVAGLAREAERFFLRTAPGEARGRSAAVGRPATLRKSRGKLRR
jgi:hypothetical protein